MNIKNINVDAMHDFLELRSQELKMLLLSKFNDSFHTFTGTFYTFNNTRILFCHQNRNYGTHAASLTFYKKVEYRQPIFDKLKRLKYWLKGDDLYLCRPWCEEKLFTVQEIYGIVHLAEAWCAENNLIISHQESINLVTKVGTKICPHTYSKESVIELSMKVKDCTPFTISSEAA